MRLQQWESEFLDQVSKWDEDARNETLFFEPHPEYSPYLIVNSFDSDYRDKLNGLLDYENTVSILNLKSFLDASEELGYSRAFFVDKVDPLLTKASSFDDPYPYDLNFTLKKFQLQGFNYLKDLPSAIVNWSTGTGKSVITVAQVKFLLESGKIDKAVIVSKNHNQINWKRTLMKYGGLQGEVASQSDRTGRVRVYESSDIFIINYEKFRFRDETMGGDGKEIAEALKGKRVFFAWDEMPNKMKNTATYHFRGAQKAIRGTKESIHWMLTAKKIDTDPENLYSCLKILDPTIFPNKNRFRKEYAKSFSPFAPWQVATWDTVKLKELGMRISHMTHVANKYTDPEIREQFPEDHWDDIIIDMSPQDRKVYDAIKKAAGEGDQASVLSKITTLQHVCNNPEILNWSESALAIELRQNVTFTSTNSAKLETLRDLLDSIDGKVVLFSAFNDFGAKMLVPYLIKWGHTLVLYDGTNKKKQEAEDRFRNDDRVKLFVSSDQGSDSINLEQATTVINYDFPHNYSTLEQRVNRISRITSEAEHVFFYNLIVADTIEERKKAVLMKKKAYEDAIDSGVVDEIAITTSLEDLLWILG